MIKYKIILSQYLPSNNGRITIPQLNIHVYFSKKLGFMVNRIKNRLSLKEWALETCYDDIHVV